MEKHMSQERQVDHFVFYSEEDAVLAQKEKAKIEYLEKHMDYSMPQNILLIYEKANKERIFRTPVGILYLQELRKFLLQTGIVPEKISPVVLYGTYEARLRPRTEPAKNRVRESRKDKQKRCLTMSVVLNVFLVLAVISMFLITLNSKNPNILNYERAITNQYASWEQQISQREQIVREKERELNLEQ